MAEAREKELHTALNEAQRAYDQHTQALQTHGPQVTGRLQQLRAEEARFIQVWHALGLRDADPIVPPRLPAPLRAPPERWHSEHAPMPLTLVTSQARQVRMWLIPFSDSVDARHVSMALAWTRL